MHAGWQADLSAAHLDAATHVDLRLADLTNADLSDADLRGADLSGADLRSADLTGANLTEANLEGANLTRADLTLADLTNANLTLANLTLADLTLSNLTNTVLGWTVLADLDLSALCKAAGIRHSGPSYIDSRAVMRSFTHPRFKEFMEACGVPWTFIEYMVGSAEVEDAADFTELMWSTFISYGQPDDAFARQLYDSLTTRRTAVFYFPETARWGERLSNEVRLQLNRSDRVILICSEHSLNRPGVLNEIRATFAREARDGGGPYLLPIALDDYLFDPNGWESVQPELAQRVRSRIVGDFRKAQTDPTEYDKALNRLIDALRKGQTSPHKPGAIDNARLGSGGEGKESTEIGAVRRSDSEAVLQGAQAWTSYVSAQRRKNPDWAADLRGADLTGADLTRMDLPSADLRGADLTGADLTDANLRGADLRHADLTDTDLTGADLTDVRKMPHISRNVSVTDADSRVHEGEDWSSNSDSAAAAAPATRVRQQRALIFRTDLGANQTMDRIAGCLSDLQIVVRTAERWGLRLRPSATGEVMSEPPAPFLYMLDVSASITRPMAYKNIDEPPPKAREALMEASPAAHDFVSDLGYPSVTVTSVTYRNPMEVLLMAAGPTFLALLSILTIIRDWSNKRSKGAAEASIAQSEAELCRFLVDQVKAGSLPADPVVLLNAISDRDIQAMRNLSESPVTLELTQGPETDDGGDTQAGGR